MAQRVRFEWVVEAGMGLDRFERSQGLKNQMILRSQKKFLKAVFEREEGFFLKWLMFEREVSSRGYCSKPNNDGSYRGGVVKGYKVLERGVLG